MLRDARLGKADERFLHYTASIDFDRRLVRYDLLGSMAHVLMLMERGIITRGDAARILSGLLELYRGGVELRDEDEDVHMAVERLLHALAGDVAGKMHTARSRNDQVALDLRMLLRDELNRLCGRMIELMRVLLRIAEQHIETVMPGYTHLQRAQPVTIAHHMLAHFWSLSRDLERLEQAYRRLNRSPLGACALAGTSFSIDRRRTAELLGFSGIVENSQDAVASRDFMLEPLAACAIASVSLSRIAEELILWSTSEFGFVELDARYCSTSSMMPQKKNPDALELMRARSAKVFGALTTALAMLKALPLAYNRDLQELSPVVLDALETLGSSAEMLGAILGSTRFRRDRLREACSQEMGATLLAEMLARECGMEFRRAHALVAKAAALAEGGGSIAMCLQEAAEELGLELCLSAEAVEKLLTPEGCVQALSSEGSASAASLRRQLEHARQVLEEREAALRGREAGLRRALDALLEYSRRVAGVQG